MGDCGGREIIAIVERRKETDDNLKMKTYLKTNLKMKLLVYLAASLAPREQFKLVDVIQKFIIVYFAPVWFSPTTWSSFYVSSKDQNLIGVVSSGVNNWPVTDFLFFSAVS